MNVYSSSQKRNNGSPIRILLFCIMILLCLALAACGTKTQPPMNASPVYEYQEIKEDADKSGLALARKVAGVPEEIKIDGSGWLDLVGDGNYNEFFLVYYAKGIPQDRDDETSFKTVEVLILSKRNNKTSILYREADYYPSLLLFTRDKAPQLIFYINDGSGGFLRYRIFGLVDGAVKQLYEDEEDYGYGHFFFHDGKLFIWGNAKYYTVNYADNKYFVKEFIDEVKVDKEKGRHVLSFTNKGESVVYFDGKKLKFPITNEHSQFVLDPPIRIKQSDHIILYDNIKGGMSRFTAYTDEADAPKANPKEFTAN